MKIDNDKIRDEKLQCDINKKNSKNINIIIWENCEEITGEEILPTDQNKMQNKLSLHILLLVKY